LFAAPAFWYTAALCATLNIPFPLLFLVYVSRRMFTLFFVVMTLTVFFAALICLFQPGVMVDDTMLRLYIDDQVVVKIR